MTNLKKVLAWGILVGAGVLLLGAMVYDIGWRGVGGVALILLAILAVLSAVAWAFTILMD